MTRTTIELKDKSSNMWMMLFVISLIVLGYQMVNAKVLTSQLATHETICNANKDNYNTRIADKDSEISIINARLTAVTGERDTCKANEIMRRGGIPVNMATTKQCAFKGVSGTGKFWDDCNSVYLYSCEGKVVDCETYKDCECGSVVPDCNSLIC